MTRESARKKAMKKKAKKISKKSFEKASAKSSDLIRKRINLVRDIIVMIAGQNANPIVDLLYKKENVNEFDIAKRLKLTINQTRNILYKLSDDGLVSFTRKKDKKNGGWYTYFWTLDVGKSFVLLRKKLTDGIEQLESKLHSKGTKRFYECKNCDIEMSEENALIYNFTCPECGEVFNLKDNTESISELNETISGMKENLALINEEISTIEKKDESLRQRRFRAEERKKKSVRDAKRKELHKLKKKEKVIRKEQQRKTKKKITKRKIVKKKPSMKKALKKKPIKKTTRKNIKR